MKRHWKVVCLEYSISPEGQLTGWTAMSNELIAPGSKEISGTNSRQLANFIKAVQSIKNQGIVIISHHLKILIQYLKNKLDKFEVKVKDVAYSFGSKVKLRDAGRLTNNKSLTSAADMLKAYEELSSILPLDNLPNTINARIREDFCNDLLTINPGDDQQTINEKKAYRANIWASNLDAPRLRLLEYSTRGGLDLVNSSYVNKVLHNAVGYDSTSYYPFLIETSEFPFGAGRWLNCADQKSVKSAVNNFPCLVEVVYEGIQLKRAYPYLRPYSVSDGAEFYACNSNGEVSGDVVSADWCKCVIWSKEVELADELYSYKKRTFTQCLQFDGSMLPSIFRAKLAPYFKTKTEKKDTPEEATAKVTLNAMAGNMQMRPIRPDELAEKLGKSKAEWNEVFDGFTDDEINAALEEDYNNTRGFDNHPLKRFWSYAQGKYLTMLGRVELFKHILENEKEFIMAATDAVYFTEDKDKYFQRVDLDTYTWQLIPTVNHSHDRIKLEDFLPRKGDKIKMLGGWEADRLEKLKILGPKRYLKQEVGKEPELVHSGLKKEESMQKLRATGDIWKHYTDDFKGVSEPSWMLYDEPLGELEDAYAKPRRVSKDTEFLLGMLGCDVTSNTA